MGFESSTDISTPQKVRFRLYLITDRQLAAARGLVETVEAALAGAAQVAPPGALAVQLREKDLDAHELYELARALRVLCSRFEARLLVNDRIDVALAADADGVHLPSNSFELSDARKLLGASRLIGVSTHRAEEVAQAAAAGADFAVFGPVYEPLSKPIYGPATGLTAVTDAVKAARAMPLYALGGITAARAAELAALEPGARPFGFAVIGAVFGAPAPGEAIRELLHIIGRL